MCLGTFVKTSLFPSLLFIFSPPFLPPPSFSPPSLSLPPPFPPSLPLALSPSPLLSPPLSFPPPSLLFLPSFLPPSLPPPFPPSLPPSGAVQSALSFYRVGTPGGVQERRGRHVTMEPSERVSTREGLRWRTGRPDLGILASLQVCFTFSSSSPLPSLLPTSFPPSLLPSSLPPSLPRSLPHPPTHRGLLSGKFKRGQALPEESRVTWVEEDRSARRNQSHPSLTEFSRDDQFWELLDAMSEIAAAHGGSPSSDHASFSYQLT